MAQSYLRTIEFKVKDAALKDAVGKLGKSLGSIDKNVAQINKSFTGLSKSLMPSLLKMFWHCCSRFHAPAESMSSLACPSFFRRFSASCLREMGKRFSEKFFGKMVY